jgi:isopropylmalate/homocitrate/citramalate synthase
MIKFNAQRRTLEREDYRYELQEVGAPNLYRDIFTYEMPPMMCFNHRVVPMMPPEEIWITDTTFRDGQQALPPFTVDQILRLYDLLHRLSGPQGKIRQSEFFLYTDKDKEAVRKCQERGYDYPQITGWIRAVKADFKLVKEMGLKETGILTSASDYHIFNKLKKTRKQALEDYLDIVRAALDEGIIPRCHFEDITRADFYGFVVPFALELMRLSDRYEMPVKIRA